MDTVCPYTCLHNPAEEEEDDFAEDWMLNHKPWDFSTPPGWMWVNGDLKKKTRRKEQRL
jgi:hypothetical protein